VLDFQLRVAMGEEGDDAPRAIAVHPGGDEFVCATAKGCRSVLVTFVFAELLVLARPLYDSTS
jgi:prolactin regulatory element-binding protein